MSATPTSQTLNKTGAAIAILLVLTLATGIGALLKLDLPPNNHDVLLVLITTVANNVTGIVQFFYGSSSTAKAKDDTISTLSDTAAKVANGSAPKADVTLPPGASVKVAADAQPTEQQP
jgi:hypothetical protein